MPLSPLARFSARDHLGDPRRGIRENLDRFLAARGVDLGGGRVLMLAHARVFGYVFNPLTVYWCHRADGTLACVVAEVHNTYGQRHAYLLHTDERGRAEVPKEFYVSPFYPVDGRYRMSLPEPGDRLALTMVLSRPGRRTAQRSSRPACTAGPSRPPPGRWPPPRSGTRGPPPSSPPGSAGRDPSSTCAGCGQCRDPSINPRRGSSDHHQHQSPAGWRRHRRGPVARRRRGGGLTRPHGRGACPVHQGGGPAAAAGQAAGRPDHRRRGTGRPGRWSCTGPGNSAAGSAPPA